VKKTPDPRGFSPGHPAPDSENNEEKGAGPVFLAPSRMSDNRHNNHWHRITPQIDKLIIDKNFNRHLQVVAY
jgi:hypothetical protein